MAVWRLQVNTGGANVADEHKFKTGKYSYKEAVIDELATASPSEYLTKISIQVF